MGELEKHIEERNHLWRLGLTAPHDHMHWVDGELVEDEPNISEIGNEAIKQARLANPDE